MAENPFELDGAMVDERFREMMLHTAVGDSRTLRTMETVAERHGHESEVLDGSPYELLASYYGLSAEEAPKILAMRILKGLENE